MECGNLIGPLQKQNCNIEHTLGRPHYVLFLSAVNKLLPQSVELKLTPTLQLATDLFFNEQASEKYQGYKVQPCAIYWASTKKILHSFVFCMRIYCVQFIFLLENY
jgi:hypothetical protein